MTGKILGKVLNTWGQISGFKHLSGKPEKGLGNG